MSPETVFKLYRAYKAYYNGGYDFARYKGNIRTPPLIQQPDRRFYYRIAQKLQDTQIHALFTQGFFFNPRAWIADFATPDALSKGLAFASRGENGQTLFEHDLYDLSKYLQTVDLDAWLYGEILGSSRAAMPECMQDVISGRFSPDLACAVLLIPQPHLDYQWTKFWFKTDFGASSWVERLRKLDTMLYTHRTGWRFMTHTVVKPFWNELVRPKSLAPKVLTAPKPDIFAEA
jgi:hypothetical protein